jgi:hypothetical protein
MNVDELDRERLPETIASGPSAPGKDAVEGRRRRSAKRAPPPKGHRGQGATQIVREWRRVYQNLYEA